MIFHRNNSIYNHRTNIRKSCYESFRVECNCDAVYDRIGLVRTRTGKQSGCNANREVAPVLMTDCPDPFCGEA